MAYTLDFTKKNIIEKMSVAIMLGSWKHATKGHYDSNNPNTRPDAGKSYFTIPKGLMPAGNDMALAMYNGVTSGTRTYLDGGVNAKGESSVKVYKDLGKVIGKSTDNKDCNFICVVVGYDQKKNQPFVFTSYPVKAIPPGTALK